MFRFYILIVFKAHIKFQAKHWFLLWVVGRICTVRFLGILLKLWHTVINCQWYFRHHNDYLQLRWTRGIGMALSKQFRGFIPSRRRVIFKGENIHITPSFGGEVKPSVTCRRFAECKRSLNDAEVVISAKLLDNILAHISTFRCELGGTCRQKWEGLWLGKQCQTTRKTFPECSVSEPYRSPDLAPVTAKLLQGLNTIEWRIVRHYDWWPKMTVTICN
jgi:hypothetical protein